MSGTGAFWIALAALLLALGVAWKPLGDYMARTYTSPKHLCAERALCRACGIDPDADQTPRRRLPGSPPLRVEPKYDSRCDSGVPDRQLD